VIFLFLVFGVCFASSTLLLDDNLAIRYVIFHVAALLFLIFLPRLQLNRLDVWLWLLYLFSLTSALWSISASQALFSAHRVLMFGLAFAFFKHLLELEEEKFMSRTLLVCFLLLLVVNSVWLVFSHVAGFDFISTSAHRNLLSSLLFLFISILLYLRQSFEPMLGRITLILIAWALVLLALLKTRSVYIALLVFGALFVLGKIRWTKKRGFIVVALMLLSVIGLFGVLGFTDLVDLTSFEERLFVWRKTLLMIADHPVWGVGVGNWVLNFTRYGVGGFDTLEIYGLRMTRPHNDLLWVLSELGVVGALLLTGFFSQLGLRWWRSSGRRESLVLMGGMLAFSSVIVLSFPSERVEHIVLFFLLAALLDHSTGTALPAWRVNLKIPALILVCVALVLGVYRVKGEWYGNKLLQAVNADEHEQVLELAEHAQSPFYRYIADDTPIASFQARAHYRLKNEPEFIHYSEQAYKEAPANYEVMNNYGMSLNAQRRYEEARDVLLEANTINPRFDGTIFNLAIVYYNLQKYDSAKVWIDRVHFKSEMTDHYSGVIHKKLGQ